MPNCCAWQFSQAPDSLACSPAAAEIEKLGILRNPVISWRDAYGTDDPAADSWM